MVSKAKFNFFISSLYNLFPFLVCFLILTLSVSIKPPSGYGLTLPVLSVVAIFYWSVYTPENLSIFQVFLLGLISDFYFGSPIGSNILLVMFLRELSFRMSFKIPPTSYFLSILLAIVVLSIYFIMSWSLLFLYYQESASIKYFLLQFILTISIYPAFMIIFGWIGRFFISRKN